jgi:hypothetical protein
VKSAPRTDSATRARADTRSQAASQTERQTRLQQSLEAAFFYNGHPLGDTAEEPATVLSLRCVPGFGAQGQRATCDLATDGSQLVPVTAIRMDCFALRVGRAVSCAGCAGLWDGSFGWSVFAGMSRGVPTNVPPAGGLPRRSAAAASSCRLSAKTRQSLTRSGALPERGSDATSGCDRGLTPAVCSRRGLAGQKAASAHSGGASDGSQRVPSTYAARRSPSSNATRTSSPESSS